MADQPASLNHLELAADIVSAYVSNNSVPSGDLPSLISDVHGALLRVAGGQVEAPAEAPKPAVAVKKSVTPDYIVCLEDGKKFKSLKRHLRTQYNMTPEQYREKWSLPADYPMVAPNYAKARSELAKEMGLGQQRKRGDGAREGSATKPRAAAKAAARPAKVTAPASRRGRKAR
jgi:MucR family transcriptional regulator, transcriptional regulator of exopolysaccharide biosynthesis